MNILTNMQNQNSSGSGSLPSNTVANPRGDVKAITTRSGVAYDGPTIPPTPSPLPKEVERETEATKDKVQNTSLGSTAHVQPPVVQDPIPEPEVAPKPKPKPLSQSEKDSLNPAAGGNLMTRNTQEALTTIENKAKVRTFRNKPQVSSNGETYDRNQEVAIQLMQNQRGQMAEALQERPSCVPPSNTVTKPCVELKAITTMDGLTLDGFLILLYNFLVDQKEEQELVTITKVVEIPSSQSTPLVPPLETIPSFSPKPMKHLKPNPHQPLIPYPSRLQEEKFQALENPTGCADYFVYRIDIVDSLCDKFPIPNDQSSGSNTSPFGHSLPDYEAFCFDIDHQEEKSSGRKSSGSTISHSDPSLLEYESFYFDLLIDPPPIVERSNYHHEEFIDELAHIISPPEYDS
ncbi:hypothetical protein Tco_0250413 [Tanacetum coccineum]